MPGSVLKPELSCHDKLKSAKRVGHLVESTTAILQMNDCTL